MKGFRHLLVALDFSPASASALEVALAVAEPGARLRLLHVVEWVPSPAEGPLVGYTKTRDVRALHEASSRKLKALASRCAGFQVETLVVEGQAARAILEEAARADVDVVIVGRRRRGRLARLSSTSVTTSVVRAASCPVLVVPA